MKKANRNIVRIQSDAYFLLIRIRDFLKPCGSATLVLPFIIIQVRLSRVVFDLPGMIRVKWEDMFEQEAYVLHV